MPSHVVAPQVVRWAAALDQRRPMGKVSIGSRSGMARHAPLRLRQPETGLLALGSSRAPQREPVVLGVLGTVYVPYRTGTKLSNRKSWTVLSRPDE